MLYKLVEEWGGNWLESELLKFSMSQNKRAEGKEVSAETTRNCLKPSKVFCEMNGVLVNWKIISKGIKRGNGCSNNRPPAKEEINKLLGYPERSVRQIVLVMISSGIRDGSWNYLKWGDVIPIVKKQL